jgi:DNA replication protein DnaC
VAHPARQPARALVAGNLPLRPPTGRQPQTSGTDPQPGIRAFAELEFIAKAENIVLVGKTGVGKTGLSCGLLLKALENGYRCQFIRAQDLFDEMYASIGMLESSRQSLDAV